MNLHQNPIMRAASRHRAIQAQLQKRGLERDRLAIQALKDIRREREDEPPEFSIPDDDEDEEPLHAEPQPALREPDEEDPLELEARRIHAWCQERLDLVTAVVESAVPMLLMAACHAVTSPELADKYVHEYLTWKHAVLQLWRPKQHWVDDMRLVKQSALVASVEQSPEFKAVRRFRDDVRRATPEYKESQKAYRAIPAVKKRNADASKLRMKRYRQRLAEKAAK